jgi:hypothetical protein
MKRVSLAIDGEHHVDVAPADLPASGQASQGLARIPLPPGNHVLLVQATAVDLQAGELRTLRTSQGLRMGWEDAVVEVDLFSRRSGGRDWGIDVGFAMNGGELGPAAGSIAPRRPTQLRCLSLEPAPRALCRAEVLLERAVAERDPVRIVCLRERIARMRPYVKAAQTDPVRNAETDSHARAERAAAADESVPELAEQQVLRVADEIVECVGDEVRVGRVGQR